MPISSARPSYGEDRYNTLGHPIIEMALAKLYKVTGDEISRRGAKYLVVEIFKKQGASQTDVSRAPIRGIIGTIAEGLADEIGILYSHVEERTFPGGEVMRHGSLVEMAAVVEFVAVDSSPQRCGLPHHPERRVHLLRF